jgi:molecular chaperone GrpE
MMKMTKQDKRLAAEEETEKLKGEIEELTNRWKRALADYQNLERRLNQEKTDFVQYANHNLITKLLSVLDHLERAQAHLKDDGLALALREFCRVLADEGLSEIEVLGMEFNPQEMEAVGTVPGEKENAVAEVVAKGYHLKDKVIRPAKVKINKSSQ